MAAKCLPCCVWRGPHPHNVSLPQCWGYMVPVFLPFSPGRGGRGPDLCQWWCPDWPLSTTAFPAVQKLCWSWGYGDVLPYPGCPLPLHPHCLSLLVALWYLLIFSGHHQPAPFSLAPCLWRWPSSHSLHILAVSFSSSFPLLGKVPFSKAFSGCCSPEKVQVLTHNEWNTIFSLSKESNERKYLFMFFPIARSQLDTSDSSLSLCFFFQCASTRSVCLLGY